MSRNHVALSLMLVLALGLSPIACGKKKEAAKGQSTLKHVTFEEGLSPDQIEQQQPLTTEGRAELTPETVATLPQWQVDQVYARLAAGPIPDGVWQGRFFFAKGGGPSSFAEAIGGLKGKIIDLKLKKLSQLGEALWKGKVFFKQEGVLRNMIDHEKILEELFDTPPGEVRNETIDGREVALLFPAKLYCGESLYDKRRQSVIIDYAETDEIEGYVPQIDYLAGRDALSIRDEIRIVRPGFYLGRAYAKDAMLLTFTLYNKAAEQAGGTPPTHCQ
jgi:hypothetical protein